MYIDVEPVSFNRGFYTVDVRYFYRITADAYVSGVRPLEVMGLAVLPARLKGEIELMREYLLAGRDFAENEQIAKHKEWAERFVSLYDINENNAEEIIRAEIGKTFVRVLEDAGVYKRTDEGREAFRRFVRSVDGLSV